MFECPYPSIGIDLDGTVDECPLFFQLLSNLWARNGDVYIITMRTDIEKTKQDLEKYKIAYNEIIFAKSFDDKAKIIVDYGILIYFDDQPEMLKNIPEDRNVFLVRNGGNFDFNDKKWMLSNQTGKLD